MTAYVLYRLADDGLTKESVLGYYSSIDTLLAEKKYFGGKTLEFSYKTHQPFAEELKETVCENFLVSFRTVTPKDEDKEWLYAQMFEDYEANPYTWYGVVQIEIK